MLATAYSPIGSPGFGGRASKDNIIEDAVIVELAAKHGKSATQIVLNWHLQRGYMIIPKTMNNDRLTENFNCFAFKLSEEEYAQIDGLNRDLRMFDPKNWGGFFNIPYFQ